MGPGIWSFSNSLGRFFFVKPPCALIVIKSDIFIFTRVTLAKRRSSSGSTPSVSPGRGRRPIHYGVIQSVQPCLD